MLLKSRAFVQSISKKVALSWLMSYMDFTVG